MTVFDATSRLLRLGIVNSGMFELLELRMDVPAIHLIGRNNVGKTSLIALLQFLYFHNIDDMWFSKPTRESLPFYFRRDGSYILFEVRTLTGLQRTVGIYGEGTSGSRHIFVFNGPFKVQEFLDEQQHVLSLPKVQHVFFNRDFYLFPKFEDYERALLGNHTVDARNVKMFDMPVEHFRQLRRLLQGLLKLSHLSAEEVRAFMIRVVESSGSVKTSINIAHDFQERHREIKNVTMRLRELQQIEPIVRQWVAATEELVEVEHRHEAALVELYHTEQRYRTWLREQQDAALAREQQIEQQRADTEQQLRLLIGHISVLEREQEQLDAFVEQFEQLEAQCSKHDRIVKLRDHEDLVQQRRELEAVLRTAESERAVDLERRVLGLERQRQNIQRQRDRRSLDAVWEAANYSVDQRTLLAFLLSQNLLALPTEEVLADPSAFLHASEQALACIDQEGTFSGFGLRVTRDTWAAVAANPSPEEQLEDVEEQIRRLQPRLAVAKDRLKIEADHAALVERIAHLDTVLSAFRHFDDMQREHDSVAALHDKRLAVAQELTQLLQQQAVLENASKQLTEDAKHAYTVKVRLASELDEAVRQHLPEQQLETLCPDAVSKLADDELKQHIDNLRGDVRIHTHTIGQLQKRCQGLRTELDAWHEREADETDFEAWVARNLDVADKIERIQDQLRESYANLIALVRGELDKLSQAFSVVESRLVDLNNLIKQVNISNIERIQVQAQEGSLVEAIRQTSQVQLDMFADASRAFSLEQAQEFVDHYLSERLRSYGRTIHLRDMFDLRFVIQFMHGKEIVTDDIYRFESNGTEIGIKIVLYLGMIRLLQGKRRKTSTRIPFFLDEVNGVDSVNLKQIIAYCQENDFLPVFASPDIRKDVSHNYVFQRDGERSYLVDTIVIVDEEQVADETTSLADHAP